MSSVYTPSSPVASLLRQERSAVAGLIAGRPLLRNALLHHEGSRRQAMAFRSRPYLVELYTDLPTCPEASVRKAVQIGFSELMLQFAFERAGWSGRSVGYMLPTFAIRNRFVQNRVDSCLQRIPAYRERLPGGRVNQEEHGPGNLTLKRFGRGTLHFLGANSPGDFVEFSCDTLIVDELDLCLKGGYLHLAVDRLRESPDPQVFRVGNPTTPRVGISAEYDASDRRRYHHRCYRCGELQPVDWFSNVVTQDDRGRWIPRDHERADPRCSDDPRPVCRRCNRSFDRLPDGGCWVAERPDGAYPRGYWVSRLDSLDQRIRPLIMEWIRAQGNTDKVAGFHASVLGIAYAGAGDRADVEILGRCATGPDIQAGLREAYDSKRDQVLTAGVDVGSVLHVQLSVLGRTDEGQRTRRTLWTGTLPAWAELRRVLREARVNICVIDAGPETLAVTTLRDEINGDYSHPCTVWLCQFFPTERLGSEDYGRVLKQESHIVQADRTQLLDATLAELRSGPPSRILPCDVRSVPGYEDQMGAPIRKLDPSGRRFIWDEGTAPDHHRLADAYDRVAADVYQSGGGYLVL